MLKLNSNQTLSLTKFYCMKHLSLGIISCVALLTLSFTLIRRSEVSNKFNCTYTPTATCYRTITFSIIQGINSITIPKLTTAQPVSFTTIPTAFGCGKLANTVEINGTAPIVLLSSLTDVIGSNPTTLCDCTINAVCCFHVNATTKVVTDVCTGIPQN